MSDLKQLSLNEVRPGRPEQFDGHVLNNLSDLFMSQ